MPITRSAKKALRGSFRRRTRNLKKKEDYKRAVKEYKKLIGVKKINEAKARLATVYQALDKAGKANAITKNKASRLKSRLAQLIARATRISS